MADDLTLDEGTGTKKAATDEVTSNRHVPWVKLASGGDNETYGALVDSSGNLQVETTNPSIAGTAGTPNAGVLSIQGITSMTPLVVEDVQTVTQGIQWSHISAYYSSAQTSANIVALSGTTKFYVGRIMVSAHYAASQAGRTTVQVYFGTSTVSDTSIHVARATFITVPGTGLESYPGLVIGDGGYPFVISAAGDNMRITTTTSGTHCGISVHIDYIRV